PSIVMFAVATTINAEVAEPAEKAGLYSASSAVSALTVVPWCRMRMLRRDRRRRMRSDRQVRNRSKHAESERRPAETRRPDGCQTGHGVQGICSTHRHA